MALKHPTRGEHYVVELSGCDPEVIGNVSRVQDIMTKAAEQANTQVWAVSFHRFPPNGVSGVVVISESHLSVHTWPEVGYAALDIYTCGEHSLPEKAVEFASQAFRARSMHITEITRGLDDGDQIFYHSIITWEEDVKPQESRPFVENKSRASIPAQENHREP